MDFFEEWFKHPKETRNEELFRFMSLRHDFHDITEQSLRNIKVVISKHSAKLSEKWNSCGRNRERFLEKNSTWLNGADISFEVFVDSPMPSTSTQNQPGPGRPSKEFDESSLKTKRRRVDDLVQSRSASELIYAAEVSARLSGQRSVARQIKDVTSDSTASEITTPRCLTNEEALAYYVDSKSTSHSYKQTRKWSIRAGHKVFPSLYSVRKAKVACYPPEEQIIVNETRAEIKVQAVLDKTTERLILAQQEVISSLLPCSSFTLTSKWGCDGSSGHSLYKQKFTNFDDSDEFLFVFSFVPLQLRDDKGNIVWQNPRPSSTMYCRPIKFIFSKETKELTTIETNKVLEEINALLPTICKVIESEVSVTHVMLLTMIDGKICNTLTETSSSQKCFICGATPSMMNDLTKEFVANKDNLGFGLSTLHAWIRCFECLLHISYRLNVKKWQLRSDEDKSNVKQRSKDIKNRFKNEMGLIVDKPKPGFGNTNDGNTARRFFEKPEASADITGLDVLLIQKFGTLLRTLSSGYDINVEKFENVAQETRQLYVNLYPWYYMPVTVHKILLHSGEVIKSSLLPIGQLSEEAQEARNKDCRRFREHNTQKQSRVATNRDLLNMLLITSDPVVNSLREVPRKKKGTLPSEVLDLIIQPSCKEQNINIVSSFHSSAIHDHDYTEDDSSDDSDDDE